jgi:endonuclease YncB( thermonuclease family)
MTRIATAALLATLTSIVAPAFAQAPPRGSGDLPISGFVRVIDGDTLEIYVGGRQTAVGIIGIKAPRGNSSCGKSSAQFLRALLMPQPVLRLVEDLDYTFDARKRRLYYLRLPGNASAAVAMARAGFVTPVREGVEADDVAAAAAEAAATGKGCAR